MWPTERISKDRWSRVHRPDVGLHVFALAKVSYLWVIITCLSDNTPQWINEPVVRIVLLFSLICPARTQQRWEERRCPVAWCLCQKNSVNQLKKTHLWAEFLCALWKMDIWIICKQRPEYLFFSKAYCLQNFMTGWCIIGDDTALQCLALPPRSNKVGLQARGPLDVLFTCSPKVWVQMCGRLFVSHCDPAIHRWLVQGVTPAAGARLQHLRDPQCSRSIVTKWTDRGAYYSAEETNKTRIHVGLMDENRCSSGEISGKHSAVSVIRIMNILQCVGYAGHMLNILSYSIITVIQMGILKLFRPFKGSGAHWLQQRRWAEQIRATSVLPRLRWNWQRVSQVSIFSNTKPSAMTTFRTQKPDLWLMTVSLVSLPNRDDYS